MCAVTDPASTHRATPEVHPLESEPVDPLAAAKLSRREHRQYLKTLDRLAEYQSGVTRTSAGRLVRPAASERKLVLFTLGILVGLLIAGAIVLGILRRDGAVVGPVVTLAGTGLGFIGGMVQKGKDETPPPPDNEPAKDPSGGPTP